MSSFLGRVKWINQGRIWDHSGEHYRTFRYKYLTWFCILSTTSLDGSDHIQTFISLFLFNSVALWIIYKKHQVRVTNVRLCTVLLFFKFFLSHIRNGRFCKSRDPLRVEGKASSHVFFFFFLNIQEVVNTIAIRKVHSNQRMVLRYNKRHWKGVTTGG